MMNPVAATPMEVNSTRAASADGPRSSPAHNGMERNTSIPPRPSSTTPVAKTMAITDSPFTPDIPVAALSSPGKPVAPLSSPDIPVAALSSPGKPVAPLSSPDIPVAALSSPGKPVAPLSSPDIPVAALSSPGKPVAPLSSPDIPVAPLVSPGGLYTHLLGSVRSLLSQAVSRLGSSERISMTSAVTTTAAPVLTTALLPTTTVEIEPEDFITEAVSPMISSTTEANSSNTVSAESREGSASIQDSQAVLYGGLLDVIKLLVGTNDVLTTSSTTTTTTTTTPIPTTTLEIEPIELEDITTLPTTSKPSTTGPNETSASPESTTADASKSAGFDQAAFDRFLEIIKYISTKDKGAEAVPEEAATRDELYVEPNAEEEGDIEYDY